MPSLTKCTKSMPEGSIVLYFQMRIFLVFQNVNMEGFEFKRILAFWGVQRPTFSRLQAQITVPE